MKTHFSDIENAISHYVSHRIEKETKKDVEELIFFSSYTINYDVFKKSTQKLKKIIRQELPHSPYAWEHDIMFMKTHYQLPIERDSERYHYLLKALIQAQIEINEAVMSHFLQLYKRAYSFDYIESRVQEIYTLLFDDENTHTGVHKTSPLF